MSELSTILDFSRTKATYLSIESNCLCDACNQLPPKTFDTATTCALYLVDNCEHHICDNCKEEAWAECPVDTCKNSVTRISFSKDYLVTNSIEALWDLKEIFFPETIKAKSLTDAAITSLEEGNAHTTRSTAEDLSTTKRRTAGKSTHLSGKKTPATKSTVKITPKAAQKTLLIDKLDCKEDPTNDVSKATDDSTATKVRSAASKGKLTVKTTPGSKVAPKTSFIDEPSAEESPASDVTKPSDDIIATKRGKATVRTTPASKSARKTSLIDKPSAEVSPANDVTKPYNDVTVASKRGGRTAALKLASKDSPTASTSKGIASSRTTKAKVINVKSTIGVKVKNDDKVTDENVDKSDLPKDTAVTKSRSRISEKKIKENKVKTPKSSSKKVETPQATSDLKSNCSATKNSCDFAKPQASSTVNLTKRNQKGETPLHVACVKNNLEQVRKLLEVGAEANTQDYDGWTPLHEAAQRKAVEIVTLLLEHGANPNVPGGQDNLSPLHDAVSSGSIPVVKILIEKGASKTSVDSKGYTPLDYCRTEELRKIVEETECEMTDSEQMNQSIRHVNQSGLKIISLSVDITQDQMKTLKNLTKQLRFKLEPKFCSKTTHLVVADSDDKTATDDATYYEALLSGVFIVSWSWIEKSVESGDFIDEEEFLVLGVKGHRNGAPEKSRLNELKQLPRLFKGFNIFLEGHFGLPYPNSRDLTKILQAGRANMLTRKPDPEAIPEREISVPFHASNITSLARCSHIIVYQEGGKNEPDLKYNMSHVKSLPAAWLFECINNFEIVQEFR